MTAIDDHEETGTMTMQHDQFERDVSTAEAEGDAGSLAQWAREQRIKALRMEQRAERAEAECDRLRSALDRIAHGDEWPDCFYEAVGWTLAECCAALDRGEDPRQMEAPALLERCKRDLSRDAAAPTDGRE